MKKLIVMVLLLVMGLFIVVEMAIAQESRELSPIMPLEERKPNKEFSLKQSEPLATVLPHPEYERLPAYDFLPKRLRRGFSEE